MGKQYEIRSVNGVDHKLCRGPLHSEGGAWLPVANFKKRGDGSGRLRGNCGRCEHYWRYGKNAGMVPEFSGLVPLARYKFAILELENRLGRIEAARRCGLGKSTWMRWVTFPIGHKIQRAKAAKLLWTLREVRESDEKRHRDSIKRGAKARGEIEKKPTSRKDFYRPHGDQDTLTKKRAREQV